MKTVNAKLFTLKYKLLKVLSDSLEKDKKAIKEGATITYRNYAQIQITDCTRTSYSKENQAILDAYAKEIGIEKQTTHFQRIDVDRIPEEVDTKVNELLNTLENNNDITISSVASKIKR